MGERWGLWSACPKRGGLPRSSPGSYWNANELPEQAGQQQSQRECQQERSGIVKRIRPDTLLLFLECTIILFGQHGSSALKILPRLIYFDLSFVDLGSHRPDLFHIRDEEEKTDSNSHDSQDNPRLFQGTPPSLTPKHHAQISLKDNISDNKSQEAASATSWRYLFTLKALSTFVRHSMFDKHDTKYSRADPLRQSFSEASVFSDPLGVLWCRERDDVRTNSTKSATLAEILVAKIYQFYRESKELAGVTYWD